MANDIADITVKKHDGTTDITYTGVQPSSGDGTSAQWKSQTVGNAPAHQPELRLSGREASNGTKREMRATFRYPQIATNSTTGLTSVVDSASASLTLTFPKAMAQSDINEFCAQFGNLVDAALIQACLKAGYSAT